MRTKLEKSNMVKVAGVAWKQYHIYIFQGFRSRVAKHIQQQHCLPDDGHEKRGKLEIYISRMKRFEHNCEAWKS